MKLTDKTSFIRINVAIGLVSAAIIAFQLVLMQILSYVQWYHFAYMIISIALLGFGAAGTFLTLFRQRLLQNYHRIFTFLSLITAVFMSVVVLIAGSESLRFDSLLIFHDLRYTGRLLLNYLIFFLPFFSGALAIGMSFLKFAPQIGKVYFANLIGSGLGGMAALLLMYLFLPEQLPFSIALIAFVGAIISFPQKAGKRLYYFAILSGILLIAVFFNLDKLKPSQYKDISKTLLLPEAVVEFEKSSPHGLVQIVSSPVLRYAPGLSLSYRQTFPIRKAVFTNGNWSGYLIPEDQAEKSVLNYTPQALPYHLQKIERALIPNAGTGENISLALSNQVPNVDATEANVEIFKLLQKSFFEKKGVILHPTRARTFMAADSIRYDLIHIPIIGSFFGNSGLNAVEIRYDLSMEAMHKMWEKLAEHGIISISCWMDYPPRNSYRLLATIDQLLEETNIRYPEKHLIAIRSWSAITFLLQKSEFTEEQQIQAQQFSDDLMFDLLILPHTKKIDRGKYNLLQDSSFFSNMEHLLSIHKKEFLKKYPFRVHASTDNRPFFFQYIRWRGIAQLIASMGKGDLPFLELGYLLILFTFFQMLVVAAVFIILPLFIKSWKSHTKAWVFVYFSGIGLAFMFVEIIFIQQFTFYFGQPIFATAASISLLLIASALGSYYSASLRFTKKSWMKLPLIIAFILLFHAVLLSAILAQTIAFPFLFKILISTLLIGITGFFLGMPFPAGIKYLSDGKQSDIPWAWAFNGYFSVISTALATIISVEAGFVWVLVLAAAIYILLASVNRRLKN